MQPASLRTHDVIVGLVDLVRTAVPDLRVDDGPPRDKPSDFEVLWVGWDPEQAYHATARRVDGDSNLLGRDTEEGEIACILRLRTGDVEMAPLRERAMEIIAAIEESLREDHTLGGACDHAGFDGTSFGVTHYQISEGAQIGISFSVEYTAYI